MGQIKKDIADKIKTAGSKSKAIKGATDWYSTALKTFLDKSVAKDGGRFVPGKIYVFRYDNPVTEGLQWWDKNPVVLALDPYNNNDVGINLNLLPQKLKETLLDDVHIRLNGQIKTNETRAAENAKAQGQLRLSYEGAKRYLDKYGFGFAIRQYIPGIKKKQAVVSYENWANIVLCDFADLQGITKEQLESLYKKYYKSKNI
jgi:hypothetical protein